MDCVGVDNRLEHDPFFQAIVGLVDYTHLLQDRRLACKCNEISLGYGKRMETAELRFVMTLATGGRVKLLPAV